MKYKLQESEKPNYWVCTDVENDIVCIFENQNFNDNQQFTFIEDVEKPNASELAGVVNQMATWLRENHYCKIIPCDIRLRIGRRIAELRTKRGYTQEEFAELIGIKQNNLSRLEHGKHSTGLDILGKIEDVLRCRLDFIDE